MNVGNELRLARQRAGLSTEQISQETKIQLAKIEALENNAFERLPDGIYLDGIVRAYAKTVGLEGDTMVQLVHRTLELRADDVDEAHGLDEPHHQPHESAPSSPLMAASGPAAIAYGGTQLGEADIDTFDRELDIAHDRGPAYLDAPAADFETFETPAEFAPQPHGFAHEAPRRRAAPIVLVVVALLAAAALGGYLFEYGRRTLTAEAVWGADDAGDRADNADTAATGATGATGAGPTAAAGVGSTTGASAANAPGRADTRAANARPVDGTAAPAPAASASAAPAAASPAPPAPANPAPESPGRAAPTSPAPAAAPAPPAPGAAPASPAEEASASLSGTWHLDTRIESSSYPDYEGLALGYRLELQQDGARVTGTGVKTLENGRTLGSAAQTLITVHGTVEGERLTLTFTERGLRRPSDGKMILSVNDDGVLRGRFSSSAAQSVGIVEARRPKD